MRWKINLEIERRKSRNKTIIIKEIVRPIVDEMFDDQGLMKIDFEKYKWIEITMLKPRGYTLEDVLQERWLDEETEELRGIVSRTIKNQELVSSILEPEDGLSKEKSLTQETSSESASDLSLPSASFLPLSPSSSLLPPSLPSSSSLSLSPLPPLSISKQIEEDTKNLNKVETRTPKG
jgi:hypothetical protein